MQFFNYEEQDFIPCEMCGARAVDIHHLERRNKTKNDFIENLVGLCRDCHIKTDDSMFNMFCRIKHLENVCVQVYDLIQVNKRLKEYGDRKDKNK
jgi:hypothetical protein